MNHVFNERIKLGASALNTLATASITVGVLAPLAAYLYGLAVPSATRALWELLLSGLAWFLVAAALHYGAQRLLGLLRP